MTLTALQFAARRHCQVLGLPDTRRHNYGLPVTLQAGLELDFHRAVRQVPERDRLAR